MNEIVNGQYDDVGMLSWKLLRYCIYIDIGVCLCMKYVFVVVYVLCDMVNFYFWNNCDFFKVFEK